jgi:hypothetical protein
MLVTLNSKQQKKPSDVKTNVKDQMMLLASIAPKFPHNKMAFPPALSVHSSFLTQVG